MSLIDVKMSASMFKLRIRKPLFFHPASSDPQMMFYYSTCFLGVSKTVISKIPPKFLALLLSSAFAIMIITEILQGEILF